jgi:ABC-type multidrug transport system permease subunit
MDMFVASPLKPVEFAIASALAHLAIIVLPATIVIIIMMLISGVSPISLILVIASIIISWITGTSFGLYIYGRLADPLRISSASNLLNLVLILLPPVIYPISILPYSLQLISIAIPTVSLKLIAQHLIGITTDIPLAVPTAIVIIYTATFTILATRQRLPLE